MCGDRVEASTAGSPPQLSVGKRTFTCTWEETPMYELYASFHQGYRNYGRDPVPALLAAETLYCTQFTSCGA